jgi:hypothetical protein
VPIAEAWEVVVTREPEWDDHQRARMLALSLYEAGVHVCGWHLSLTTDPEINFGIEDEPECQVCAATAQLGRITEHADESLRKRQRLAERPDAPDPADGRRRVVRLRD